MTISGRIREYEAEVEAELRAMFRSRNMGLYEMLRYHMGWESDSGESSASSVGRRIHGVVCLAACEALEGDPSLCLPGAAAVELTHAFVQIHDDVQSGNPRREGMDAVWWKWGPAQAINAGDAMYALARIALFRLEERGATPEMTFRAVQILDEMSLALCEGRFHDLESQERIDMSVDAYLTLSSDKTASLYAGAAKLGALAAGADDSLSYRLAEFASRIGLARQIHDDLNELRDGQEPSLEVMNKKKLLPVVYSIQQADVSTKRRIGDIYFKRVLDPTDVAALRAILEESGGLRFAEDTARKLRQEALDSIDRTTLQPSSKDLLKGLAAAILSG